LGWGEKNKEKKKQKKKKNWGPPPPCGQHAPRKIDMRFRIRYAALATRYRRLPVPYRHNTCEWLETAVPRPASRAHRFGRVIAAACFLRRAFPKRKQPDRTPISRSAFEMDLNFLLANIAPTHGEQPASMRKGPTSELPLQGRRAEARRSQGRFCPTGLQTTGFLPLKVPPGASPSPPALPASKPAARARGARGQKSVGPRSGPRAWKRLRACWPVRALGRKILRRPCWSWGPTGAAAGRRVNL